uniref:Uncharacterized protein n=1 Tax=Caenorhabditis japonica TaxID=281687 RepID=A0A8R1ED21_CAEJA
MKQGTGRSLVNRSARKYANTALLYIAYHCPSQTKILTETIFGKRLKRFVSMFNKQFFSLFCEQFLMNLKI